MSDEFSVDLEHLEWIVSRLSGLSGFLTEQLDGLDDKVAKVNGTGWDSVAAEAYTTAHQKWTAEARELADGILVMSAAAKHLHGRYTDAAETNKQMLGGG
jgi:WXG100 family type VII secretion target